MTSVDEMASAVPTGRRDAGGVPDRSDPVDALGSRNEGAADLSGTPFDDRDAWLAWRSKGVGASDVAGILGLSPWTSPWSVWAEKVGLTPGQDETAAMEFGKMAEPLLKAYFEKRTGLWIRGEQQWCAHPSEPWMLCTTDGFVFESHSGSDDLDDALAIVEFKATSDAPWDEVPLNYQCQASWAMAVTGMSTCWFGVLHLSFGRPDFRVYEFHRDDVDIAMLIGRCRTFWFDHVVAGEPPAADGHPATVDAVNHAWAADTKADAVEAGEFGRALHAELMDRKAEFKSLESEIDALEVSLKISLRTATSLVDGEDDKGKPIVLATWNPQQQTGFDVKGLRVDHPDLAEQYTTKNIIRVLRPKPLKGE